MDSTTANTQVQTINIDLVHIQNIADIGVRRAGLFMGLGINAAKNPNFIDYQLHKVQGNHPTIAPDFLPRDADTETIEEYKEEFSTWITGCGFREILEYYGLALNHIHQRALLVKSWEESNHSLEELNKAFPSNDKAQKEFYKSPSVPKKIKTLLDRFGITPETPEALTAFHFARNALTHGVGYVRAEDCNEDGLLRLKWMTLTVYGKGTESGEQKTYLEMRGVVTTEPTSLFMEAKEQEKIFKVGEKVALSAGDLWEICLFFQLKLIPTLIESFKNYLKSTSIHWK